MFRRTKTRKQRYFDGPIEYPSGTALECLEKYYYVKSGKLFRFGSERAFQSWNLFSSICLPENINHYFDAGVLGFREGSLLSKFSDGTLHVVADNKTRHIVNPDALDKYGLLGKPIWEVSDKEFNLHDIGEVLDGE